MIAMPRPRRARRRRWLADAAALALVLVLVAVTVTSIGRLAGQGGDPDRGFQLEADQNGGPLPAELATLEHPAPEDTREHWPPSDEPGAALEGSAWWSSGEFRDGQGALFDSTLAWRPHNPYRHLDLATPLVNVEDGGRRTWVPPACECPTVTVWVYGGSTTFGLNQRDDHTISSELAKVAHEAGIRLEVSNRGQMGHVHWQEAERFRIDLLEREPPDVVIFYDGVNDAWAAHQLSLWRTRDLPIAIDPTLVGAWEQLKGGRGVPAGPPGASLIGFPRAPLRSVAEQARLTVARWDRSRRISQAAADSHGVLARYAWQPSRYSRDLVPAEPHGDATQENSMRLADQVMRDSLPDDVISLVDVFDDITGPLFTDDVHHNEAGSRIVAEALYAAIEPDLRRISDQRGGG